MSRVVLAMSGGVDSSVAAHLLLSDGHEVIGVFMRHGEQSPVTCETGAASDAADTQLQVILRPDHKQGCCTSADAEDARRVADKLNIPFFALNLQQEFRRIIDYFVDEYTHGRTPNPCVQCNNWIKFGKLFDYADSVDAQYVATGHYARLRHGDAGNVELLRGVDSGKDQSYVLFGIAPELLPRMLLPVGEYKKPTIRAIAEKLGLAVAEKQDSQEICFVTRGRYDAFVRSRREHVDTSGELITTEGQVVGRHHGIEGFTIGQRKGLGVALGEPRYVVRIDAESHRVVLGSKEELGRMKLTASGARWHIVPPHSPLRCTAQIRYNATPVPATVVATTDAQMDVQLYDPQFGVAPGQAVVFYDGDRVLGGGWIE